MDNMNIDQNTMNNIKKMVDNGDLSGAMSQISPEMIQNFSKMLSNNQEPTNSNNSQDMQNSKDFSNLKNNMNYNSSNNQNTVNNNNSNFGDIDMATVMKLSSALSQVKNSGNDPRSNLLNSLKPYLKNENREKVDEYMKLLNITKVAEIMNENNKNNKNPNTNNNRKRF